MQVTVRKSTSKVNNDNAFKDGRESMHVQKTIEMTDRTEESVRKKLIHLHRGIKVNDGEGKENAKKTDRRD